MNLPDLTHRFRSELARTFDLPRDRAVVTLEGDGRGGISAAWIDLTGARIDPQQALAIERTGDRRPDVVVDRLELKARPLFVEGAGVWLDAYAERVGLATYGGPPRFVTLERGTVEGTVDRRELEAAALDVGRQLGTRYGVQVEAVDLALVSPHPRVLDVRARVRAGKRILVANVRTTVEGSARLESIPDRGIALADVTYHGEGPLASVVRGILSPRLDRLTGKILPLPVIPGRIVEARFDVGEAIRMNAELRG